MISENWLFSIVLIVILVYIILEWYGFYRIQYHCPKCDARGKDIKKVGKEDFGRSIKNHNVVNSRSIYVCKKCSYSWTVSSSRNTRKK
ncbi:hypothetical protein [uncultured Aquimarina sp.]|uniref:hypothetical protein n=1 Tax=uncultured Aquimarina sp. TaxID=575652 RepID=UPI0026100735|nr:hypothetical protein [uncultured Aquimarina sp.]